MVEQVRHGREENERTLCEVLVSDSGGQMGFATAISADQHQPAIGVIRVSLSYFERLLNSWYVRIEIFEVFIAKSVQVRNGAQVHTPLLGPFGLFTFTGNRLAKVGMPIGNVGP